MSELDKARREIATELQQPGLRPDPSVKLTRRTFIHRCCVLGAATVADTFSWWPLINTIDVAHAADAPFKICVDFRHPSIYAFAEHALRR